MHGVLVSDRILQTINPLCLDGDPGAFGYHGGMTLGARLGGGGRFKIVSLVAFLAAFVPAMFLLMAFMIKNEGFEEHVPVTLRARSRFVHELQHVMAFDARLLSPLIPDVPVMVEENDQVAPIPIDDHRAQAPRAGDGRGIG